MIIPMRILHLIILNIHIIAECLSARHLIREYGLVERIYVCMYVSHALASSPGLLRTPGDEASHA